MARRRTPPESVRAKWLLADRLRTVRTELFGDRGLAELARLLGVPVRTWYSYESGVTVPAEILLSFIELTAVEPHWLLHGAGSKYVAEPSDPTVSTDCSPSSTEGLAESSAPVVPTADLALALVNLPVNGDAESSSRIFRTIRIAGDAMEPIVSHGAIVAYATVQEAPCDLEGKLIVAEPEGRSLVRWLHVAGNYGVLRAENPEHQPATELFDLECQKSGLPMHRVLWVGTSH